LPFLVESLRNLGTQIKNFLDYTALHWALHESKRRAEQSKAVAYCRQPASTVTLGIEPRWDPWPYICSVSRHFFFLLSLFLLW
jgi:hypothetical protein